LPTGDQEAASESAADSKLGFLRRLVPRRGVAFGGAARPQDAHMKTKATTGALIERILPVE
jgi:hypothetical protein